MSIDRPPEGSWVPTPAHLRAVAMAAACLVAAAVGRRADLAVLGAPFLAVAAWGARHRPRGAIATAMDVEARALFEGQATVARVAVTPAPGGGSGDVVAAVISPGPWMAADPPGAAAAATSEGGRTGVEVPLRAMRWGRHEVALRKVTCTSPLGAYRAVGGRVPAVIVTTMPRGADFNAIDAMPRPAGLVGLHRSRRQGPGSEPAEVRPFRPGDRLRHINWAVSSRTGSLHVTSTWADRDAHVVLLLDTEHDVGVSEGIDGSASSLDTAVRGAAAIGEHYLRAGDRVGLVDLGRRVRDVPAGSGRRHLRRLLEVLVAAQPGPSRGAESVRIRPLSAGALVIALTPLVGRTGPAQIAHLVQHGHTVVVVDTLPDVDRRRGLALVRPRRAAPGDRAGDGDRPSRRARRPRRALARPGHP